MIAVGAVVKWGGPAAVVAGGGVLAVDAADVGVAVVGAVQAIGIAWIGWKTFRAQATQERRANELEQSTTLNTVQIEGQGKFIDQLQETSVADRQLIAQLQAEVALLNTEVIRLNRQLVATTTGAMQLQAQLQANDIVPVWMMPVPDSNGG